jgi:hypothetical protein
MPPGHPLHINNLDQTVTSDFDSDSNPWDKHVDGALALIQLRGAAQLRNRISRSIFLNLTTEIVRCS